MLYKNNIKGMGLRKTIISRMVKAACLKTQNELANNMDITPSQISDFIRRDDGAFYKRIYGFAEKHNKSIDWLLTGEELSTGKSQNTKVAEQHSNYQQGKESQINKPREGKKLETKKLYGIEDLSQDKLDKLQEIIDNWTEEELKQRKAKRISKSEPKKNHNSA